MKQLKLFKSKTPSEALVIYLDGNLFDYINSDSSINSTLPSLKTIEKLVIFQTRNTAEVNIKLLNSDKFEFVCFLKKNSKLLNLCSSSSLSISNKLLKKNFKGYTPFVL